MTKIRSYLVAVIALLLLAGPWLQSAEVRASSDEPACGCCQGPCQGCCCSKQAASEQSKPDDDQGGCRCEMSELPATPAVPMEFHEYRLIDKTVDIVAEGQPLAQADPELSSHQFTLDKSPPLASPRPVYVLFSTLLI